MMAGGEVDEFEKSVDDGLRLSKRIYFGRDRSVAPPKPIHITAADGRSSFLPTSPMAYAVVPNPAIVDNPDIPSYQPHVHGRCDPPALIPLQMNSVSVEVDSFLDTALVTLYVSWRVHCVMASASCHCRVAIPLGPQGSILGVEVEVPDKSYSTKLLMDYQGDEHNVAKGEDGGFLKSHIFTFTIPQIDGGSNFSIKANWSQKITYSDGQFTLKVPFSFPEYVTPAGKKMSKKEKIQMTLHSCHNAEVLCKTTSHPLKELRREAGKLGFIYQADVLTWSCSDFVFVYSYSSSTTFGGVLLQSPSVPSNDQRDMFCLYIFPGTSDCRKVFRKEVVFVVDISGSMRGKAIEDTKSALIAAISKLDEEDSFTVIAFNDETYLFSSTLELATEETVKSATQWISMNFIAGGGTNMLLPLNQAIELLSGARKSIPLVFFITDGAVEDERDICDVMKSHLVNQESICPRIYTFGIGSFCNHYFLRMLATIGRGFHEAAYDIDSIEVRLKGLFSRAISTVLANVVIEGLDNVDDLQVFPFRIPDVCSEGPLIICGRYRGDFPGSLKARGILADMNNLVVDLKVQQANGVALDKMLVKEQIDLYTSQAWFSQDKELEDKIAKMSVQYGVVSEFTRMILLETEVGKQSTGTAGVKKVKKETGGDKQQKNRMIRHLGIGFGNVTATTENTVPGSDEVKLPETAEMFVRAASNCCGKLFGHCCCMCCIQACSRINDQCAIALTQLCGGLAIFGCFAACEACCCCGQE